MHRMMGASLGEEREEEEEGNEGVMGSDKTAALLVL